MTTVATADKNTAVAPLSTPADGLMYEQSLSFLAEQAARAQQLAELAQQIHDLQIQLRNAAATMLRDHEQAQAGLARFGVTAPNVAEAIGLLSTVAGDPATEAAMITTFMALDVVTNGCVADRQNLASRFGTAWEIMRAEGADGQYVNG